jgi:hypothetical protein
MNTRGVITKESPSLMRIYRLKQGIDQKGMEKHSTINNTLELPRLDLIRSDPVTDLPTYAFPAQL